MDLPIDQSTRRPKTPIKPKRGIDLRSDDRTESRPFHHYIPVCPLTHFSDFRSDMFSFPITIGPNHQQVGIPSFVLEIPFHIFEFLASVRDARITHLVDFGDDLCVKEGERVT